MPELVCTNTPFLSFMSNNDNLLQKHIGFFFARSQFDFFFLVQVLSSSFSDKWHNIYNCPLKKKFVWARKTSLVLDEQFLTACMVIQFIATIHLTFTWEQSFHGYHSTVRNPSLLCFSILYYSLTGNFNHVLLLLGKQKLDWYYRTCAGHDFRYWYPSCGCSHIP